MQPTEAPARRIFINYRRGDGQAAAGRLYDQLLGHFGRHQVFMDVDAIEPGVDFVNMLDEQVANCSAFIAVIGPSWLDASDRDGKRRLDNPTDYVRVEIESALKRDVRVIPVLVDGATMPQASDLPASLQPLARRNAVEVAHHRFASDCDNLAQSIERAIGRAIAGPPPLPHSPGIAPPPPPAPAHVIAPPPPLAATPAIAAPPPLASARAIAPPPPLVAAGGGAKLSWPQIVFSFAGRISRKQFSLAMLCAVAIFIVIYLAMIITLEGVFGDPDTATSSVAGEIKLVEGRVGAVLAVVFFWPGWALVLKRLHDLGQGWNVMWAFVALDVVSTALDLAGQDTISTGLSLIYLGLLCMLALIKGTAGANRYGPDPLARA